MEDEHELDGEIWRSGKLHSDNEQELSIQFGIKSRRMRESACTVSDQKSLIRLCHFVFVWTKPKSTIRRGLLQ